MKKIIIIYINCLNLFKYIPNFRQYPRKQYIFLIKFISIANSIFTNQLMTITYFYFILINLFIIKA